MFNKFQRNRQPSAPVNISDIPPEAHPDLDAIGEFGLQQIIPPKPLYGRFHRNRTAALSHAHAEASAALKRQSDRAKQCAALLGAASATAGFEDGMQDMLDRRTARRQPSFIGDPR